MNAEKPPDRQTVTALRPGDDEQPAALRHRLLRLSFALMVLVPTALAALYLWLVAADQYHSDAAFSVRSVKVPFPSFR